jgi:hypothetical protein
MFAFANTKLVEEWALEVDDWVAKRRTRNHWTLGDFLDVPDTYTFGLPKHTFMSKADSYNHLHQLIHEWICAGNPEETTDFLQTVVSVFNGTNQRCVVIFQGPAGTGKTQLCQLFKQIVGYSAAADMNRMDVRGTGDHAFSNLVGMRLICGEEFNTGTDETKLEKIKQIFGGTPTQTAMKYANKGGLIGGFIRTPIFLTANQNPLHPVHMNIHEAAWNRRIYTFHTHSCDPQWLADNTYGAIHPLAFKAFCTKFNVDLYQ